MRVKLLEVQNNKKMTLDEYFDLPKEEQEEILSGVGKSAIARAHALGLAITHGDGKGIYKLYPDGHREYTKLYTKEEIDD